ncbi:MAG: HK97 family phage prohead protease [Gammaproteobacteria bacterium]|nr:HK97 family phage prohead protease [Gammaproteobacteria bacterium]
MKTKHSTFNFEIKESSEDKEFFYFEGYGATFNNVDFGGDAIAQGAFSKSLMQSKVVPVLYQHNTREPVGIFTELKEDSHGLFVKGKLPKEDSLVRDRIIPQMKIGSIAKMSIGYMVKDSEVKSGVRILKELELFEISLVTFPMNDRANITAIKDFSFNDFNDDEKKEIIDSIKEFYKESGMSCPMSEEKFDKTKVEESVKSVRDAEELLKEAGFSQSASKTMISIIKQTSDIEEKQVSFISALALLSK